MYLYSLIPPNSELGEEMGLRGKLGSVLWRYEEERMGEGRMRLVNVDVLPLQRGVRWELEELSSLLHRHWP